MLLGYWGSRGMLLGYMLCLIVGLYYWGIGVVGVCYLCCV